jgi:predicted nucleic acid-binding protein
MLRIVLDTNIAISGLIWRGTPHFIVSGDQDLLVLQAFEGIPIVTAAQALERLKA